MGDYQLDCELEEVRARMERMVGWRLLVPFNAREEDSYQTLAKHEHVLLESLR